MRSNYDSDELEQILEDRGTDLDRMKAFSDGVFAIVITILVLELRVPQVSAEKLPSALLEMLPKFTSYVISYLLVGLAWIVHNRLLRYFTGYDRGILWLNILQLFFVSMVPFFCAVFGSFIGEPIAWALYACVLALSSAAANLMWNHAINNGLVSASVSPVLAKYIHMRGIISIAVFVASIPIAFINPLLAAYSTILIPLALMIMHKLFIKFHTQ